MNRKVLNKTCNIFLDILIGLFCLILVVTIYNDVQVKIFNKSYADFFGYSTFEVQTGSMAPVIKANDLIIVKRDYAPKVNDIITYKKGDNYITHRVVEAYKETFVTKGDANNTKDEAIKKNQIVGRVVKIIPNFGAIRKTLLNPLALITLIVTVYIISRLFSNQKFAFAGILSKLKKNKEENTVVEDVEEKPISVNVTEPTSLEDLEIEELKKELENVEILEDPNTENSTTEEDYEKTIFFRTVSVDSKDLNPAPPEIVGVIEEEPIVIEEEIKEEEETEKLKKLKKKHKKFNNVIEKVIFIKEQEINELLSILNNERLRTNEATIKEQFLKIYIDGKYYSHCGDVVIDYTAKNMCSKLEEVLEKETSRMIKEYSGNDKKFEEKVLKFKTLFATILHIECLDSTYEEMDMKVPAYKKKITKYLKYENEKVNEIIKEIVKIQKIYKKILNDILNSVETSTFELHYNPLSSNKNIYGLILDHNINFSKVYSNYIISKTYDEGVVAEDKILVLLNMLLNQIAEDMLYGYFKNKYLLYLPTTLYEKKTKLNSILKLISDEYVKNSVLILVKSSVIVNNKKMFQDLIRLGYRIAILYDPNQPKGNNNSVYSLATYLFVDKKLGKDLKLDFMDPKTVIYEDISTKIDIPRGEE